MSHRLICIDKNPAAEPHVMGESERVRADWDDILSDSRSDSWLSSDLFLHMLKYMTSMYWGRIGPVPFLKYTPMGYLDDDLDLIGFIYAPNYPCRLKSWLCARPHGSVIPAVLLSGTALSPGYIDPDVSCPPRFYSLELPWFAHCCHFIFPFCVFQVFFTSISWIFRLRS